MRHDAAKTDSRPLAIFLMGPTASGKTALALELADSGRFGLISVDSALIYRGLDIGSAKPDAATLARYPHALIDILDPEQSYSAAEFCRDARVAMDEITARGQVPLLVGGTGLYFRALGRGLSDLPQTDPEMRARVEAEAAERGWAALHAELRALDPVAGARIHPNDPQRIGRALEVIRISGQPLSALQGRAQADLPYRVLKLALLPDRAVLHQRIAERFDVMLAAGFLDEVRTLVRRPGLHVDLPSMRCVGYRQAWQHLRGEIDAETFRRTGIEATRQLAKRQITWIRSEHDVFVRDPLDPFAFDSAKSLIQRAIG
ncbi:MAG: tRNA (adenosine(37)-N6)-dimethylallyltransferase MiaA [Xanthomonadales bacterium]|nr:tRNA (adenosine(37)-N6)-dimethylallyltransferase MiaA [Xanthomonadales bacterium]MCC6560017.1 tRNA (adenosine(37)-N6)-dimethylallyltransferase MiaA [Xanthomonadales bacterium]